MLWAMGIGANLCIAIGSFPQYLYSALPYPVDYEPYTTTHIFLRVQLLLFSALAFVILKLTNLYPPELCSLNIGVDCIYRRLLPGTARWFVQIAAPLRDSFIDWGKQQAFAIVNQIRKHHGPCGIFAQTWLNSSSVLLVTLFLATYLLVYFEYI